MGLSAFLWPLWFLFSQRINVKTGQFQSLDLSPAKVKLVASFLEVLHVVVAPLQENMFPKDFHFSQVGDDKTGFFRYS